MKKLFQVTSRAKAVITCNDKYRHDGEKWSVIEVNMLFSVLCQLGNRGQRSILYIITITLVYITGHIKIKIVSSYC